MRIAFRSGFVMLLAVGAVALLADNMLRAQQPDGGGPSFEQTRQRYERDLQRPSLFIRTRSAERMAATGDPRAMELLMQRYLRPRDDPQDHVRYTTASIAGRFFNGQQFVEKWSDWLGRAPRDADSWLWFYGQQVRVRHGQRDEVVNGIARQRNHYLRAATLEALAATGRLEALTVIPQLLGERLPSGNARALLVEACASVLYRLRHELGSDQYREAAEYVIRQLGERGTAQRTKLVIARHLKAIFNEPVAHDDVEGWMRSLERGTANPAGSHDGPTRVQFMDVPAVGERVAFVIDFSDSMMIPLTAGEREELRGPSSGGQGGGRGDGLPWDRITNRFELAREELKRAINALPEDIMFCVVVFGTESEFLDSTPRLVQARNNVKQAVIRELDNVRPGPPIRGQGRDREHGTLMGDTNMHGAFLDAFRVTDSIVMPADEHVAARGFTHGVDTIFLLSDGAPSCDNFMAVDERDPEDMAGDPEMGRLADRQDQTHLNYHGPYVRRLHAINHLLEDLRRMNLHRKCEIHCIGIGEFDPGLLESIASIGMGQFRSITGDRRGN